jgi:nickel transport protein
MKLPSRFLIAAGIAGSLAVGSVAHAHAIWFAERGAQLALIYGLGADDRDMVKRQPLITSVHGYDADYRPVSTRLRVAGPLLLVDSDEQTTVETAAMDYGLWTLDAKGEWQNKGKDQVPGAKLSEHNFKYGVHLTGAITKPLPLFPDQVLQIVPVDPNIPQQMGKPLRLRVVFKGKPIAGALVQRDFVNDPDDVGQKTAADGTATIAIRNQGLNVVVATYVAPTDQPGKYDQMEYKATLAFVLPHAPE